MNAVDTNVLIYAHDPRDARKQQVAVELLSTLANPVLIWQVACEFRSAGAKLEVYGFDGDRLLEEIEYLRSYWTTVLPRWETFDRSEQLRVKFSLSFWDSLLIAAAIDAGCDTLYSEDFDGYAVIENLNLINPFAATH